MVSEPQPGSAPKKKGVRVVVRQRPAPPGALEGADAKRCVKQASETTLELRNPRNPDEMMSFNFDRCLDGTASQATLFNDEVMPFLHHAAKGFNASCFCYGPTGAGKTHTMQGTDADPGIIPRSVEALLRMVTAEKTVGTFNHHRLTMSYLELYNEKIFDLLEPKDKDLPIRANAQGEIIIPNLAEVEVTGAEQFHTRFASALAKRKLAPTKLNSTSSRSHAVLIVKLKKVEAQAPFKQINGKLHLVDLAGSEDNRRTGNVGAQMKESKAINSSLMVLGKVVDALNAKHHRIPYRDSKLTRLLQDSLGGKSHACMVLNIAPMPDHYQETYNGLKFASKSRNVFNAPVVNAVEPAPKPAAPAPRPRIKSLAPPSRVLATSLVVKRRLPEGIGGPGKRPRITVSQPQAAAPTESSASSSSATTSISEEQLEQRLLLKMASMASTGHRSADESEDALEKRLMSKMESMISQLVGKGDNAAASSAAARTAVVFPAKAASKMPAQAQSPIRSDRPSTAANAPPAMTPSSKMMVAKAVLCQAKAYKEDGKLKSALEHYQQAHKLLPHKIKLKEIIVGLENELKAKAAKKKPAQGRPAWGHTAAAAAGPKINKRLALGNIGNTGIAGGYGNGNGKTKRKASKIDEEDEAASDPEWEPLENDDDDTFELKSKKKKDRSSKTPTPTLDTPEPEQPAELDAEAKAAFAVKLVSLLNSGDIKQLLKMAGVGKKRAENIISFRENERTFNKIDDLRLCGFGDKMVSNFFPNNLTGRAKLGF